MSKPRFEKINKLNRRFDSFSDGAFIAAMQENGVYVDELADFAREQERREEKAEKEKEG